MKLVESSNRWRSESIKKYLITENKKKMQAEMMAGKAESAGRLLHVVCLFLSIWEAKLAYWYVSVWWRGNDE